MASHARLVTLVLVAALYPPIRPLHERIVPPSPSFAATAAAAAAATTIERNHRIFQVAMSGRIFFFREKSPVSISASSTCPLHDDHLFRPAAATGCWHACSYPLPRPSPIAPSQRLSSSE
ncbi:hypothetical protein IF2G_01016 [Cordyceps javanica]|nr:hypothetical protein IF2G_01016 [Cordyceps javanica]